MPITQGESGVFQLSRQAKIRRETRETDIEVTVVIDGSSQVRVDTPVQFFNHMLSSMLYYSSFDAEIRAVDKQDFDDHHVVEDVAIVLGQAIKQAAGDKRGIARFSQRIVPMDDALVMAAMDFSGRAYSNIVLPFSRSTIGTLATENIIHFFHSLSQNAGFNLHLIKLAGTNEHHVAEASFKAVGLCLRDSLKVTSSDIPSMKGSL